MSASEVPPSSTTNGASAADSAHATNSATTTTDNNNNNKNSATNSASTSPASPASPAATTTTTTTTTATSTTTKSAESVNDDDGGSAKDVGTVSGSGSNTTTASTTTTTAGGTTTTTKPTDTAELSRQAGAGQGDDDDDDEDFEDKPTTRPEAGEKETGAVGAGAGDEEEGTNKSGGAVVFLRGKLRMEDSDTVLYTGVWASSKEDFADKSKTSKIKYETTMTKQQLQVGDLDGTSWDGYFLLNQGKDEAGKTKYRRIKEDGLEISAKQGATPDHFLLSGNGVNEFGAFAVTGVFNKATRQLMITKQYEADDDDDDDVVDDRTQEEVANELALLRAEATMDLDELQRSGQLKKRKAQGDLSSSKAPVPAKRGRRQSAMVARNRWRDELQMKEAGGKEGSGGDELQQLTDSVNSLRKRAGSTDKLMKLLRALGDIKMTVADLSRTKVGSVVNKLAKKHDDLEVKRVASRLVKTWREVAAKETQ